MNQVFSQSYVVTHINKSEKTLLETEALTDNLIEVYGECITKKKNQNQKTTNKKKTKLMVPQFPDEKVHNRER